MYFGVERFYFAWILLVLFGLMALVMVVPVVGYVLLGLVVAGVLGLVGGFGVMWWRTRWQPPVDQHRSAQTVLGTAVSEREVA